MRTIKFRAYDTLKKEMVNTDCCFYSTESGWKWGMKFGTRHPDEIELMQFTGLTDKNGKEIYEGDIRCGKYYFQTEEQTSYQVMKWDEKNACFYWDGQDIPSFVGVEIIGNIYENPNLLNND